MVKIVTSRSGPASRGGSRRRSVASSTKPSLRGTPKLASLRGSIRISIRSAPQTSKPTRVSAALDSVAIPRLVALARIQ